MICKTCGMDSKTAGTCSWCGASLASPDETPAEIKPERARPVIREEAEPEAPEAEVEIGKVPSLHSLRTEPGTPQEAHAPPATTAPPASPLKVTSARKMAPPLPSPGSKLRAPAPAMPPPSTRPVTSLNMPAVEKTPASASPAHAPIASLQEQADALIVPASVESAASSLLSPKVAVSEDAPPAAPSALSAPTLTATPLVPTLSGEPETIIGSGVTPPKSTTPAAAMKPPTITEQQKRAAVEAAMAESVQSPMELLGRYLGVFVVIMLITGALAHFLPRFYWLPMIVAMFVAAMLLPIMRVTPWVEEDAEDVVLFIGLTLVFGPLIALIIYGVIAAVRQSFNASVLGGLAVAALLRIVAEVSAGHVSGIGPLFAMTSPFAGLQHVDSGIFKQLLLNWSGFAALAGWYAASSFHKEDE